MVKYTKPKRKTMKKRPMAKKSLTRKVNIMQKQLIAQKPEKIRISKFASLVPVGQVLVNGEGAVVFDVTPQPTLGDQTGSGTAQRQGSSINLMSSHYNFMIGQQDLNNFETRLKITWVMIKGAPYTTATLISQFFNNMFTPNPFVVGIDIRDANCSLNPDYFGTYRILGTKTLKLKSDELTGVIRTLSASHGFKYNRGKGHTVRFNQNLSGDGNVFDGQILMICQADRGNSSSGTANAGYPGVYSTTINTGLLVSYNRTDYYYDT